ncbi:MAG: hypothetical protein PHE22_11330 [Mesotoga sp.]|nr:hypothetical protein [Mesotoga sp.]HPB64788.1 hypothetical protein [Mesotoga sp.]
MTRKKTFLVFFLLLVAFSVALSMEQINEVSKTNTVVIDGENITYTVTAGLLPVADQNGKEMVRIFSVSYERLLEREDPSRPVTFAFNGGPGVAAMFLHFGAFGPRVADRSGDGAEIPAPPYSLVDNPYTLLDVTDLVFVDPVGTGYSEVADGIDPQRFWDVKEDVAVFAGFIQSYLDWSGRRRSPVYILGESYGGIRGSYLASYLQDFGIFPEGIIFISPVFDLGTIQWSSMDDTALALSIPTYTAAAWYHGKLPAYLMTDLQKAIDSSREWVEEEYIVSLWKGSELSEERKWATASKLSDFTGIDAEVLYKRGLRVNAVEFATLLLEEEGRSLSMYDARITAFGPYVGDSNDETMFALSGQLKTCANDYFKRELGYLTALPYRSGNAEVYLNWNWESGRPAPVSPDSLNTGYPDASKALAQAITRAPYFKVFVASGRFDLECPYESVAYSLNHLEIPQSLQKNITHKVYPGGHMIYFNPQTQKQLREDLLDFYGR